MPYIIHEGIDADADDYSCTNALQYIIEPSAELQIKDELRQIKRYRDQRIGGEKVFLLIRTHIALHEHKGDKSYIPPNICKYRRNSGIIVHNEDIDPPVVIGQEIG